MLVRVSAWVLSVLYTCNLASVHKYICLVYCCVCPERKREGGREGGERGRKESGRGGRGERVGKQKGNE